MSQPPGPFNARTLCARSTAEGTCSAPYMSHAILQTEYVSLFFSYIPLLIEYLYRLPPPSQQISTQRSNRATPWVAPAHAHANNASLSVNDRRVLSYTTKSATANPFNHPKGNTVSRGPRLSHPGGVSVYNTARAAIATQTRGSKASTKASTASQVYLLRILFFPEMFCLVRLDSCSLGSF